MSYTISSDESRTPTAFQNRDLFYLFGVGGHWDNMSMVLEYEEKKYLFDYVADIFKGGFPKPGAQPGHFIGGAKLIGCGWIAE